MIVENNKVVTVHYELHLTNGDMADKADDSRPFSFVHGAGNTIAGFDSNLAGLKNGDSFKFTIEPADAYGEYNPEEVVPIPRSIFMVEGAPDDILHVGNSIPMQDQNGNTLYGVIAEIHDEHVHMDFNHPLAGQSLIFSGTVVGVRDGSEQEIALGEVQE